MIFFSISFFAGVLTVLAPCVLLLLPVVIGSTAQGHSRLSPYVVVLSLGVSIIVFTFVLKVSTVFMNIPPYVWAMISGGILVLFGLTLLIPALWEMMPGVSKLSVHSNKVLGQGYSKKNFLGDVLVGAALGPVFSSCSPTYFVILATVIPVNFFLGSLYICAYVLGLSLVLLSIALVGNRLVKKLSRFADGRGAFKKGVGMFFVILGVLIMTGIEKRIETVILERGYFDVTKLEYMLLDSLKEKEISGVTLVEDDVLQEGELYTDMSQTEIQNVNTTATALFANGCFWCVEHDLEKVAGVLDVVSGYAGGSTKNPTYGNYHDGGHREVVEVTYDTSVVSYGNLVEHIIKHGDPTDPDGSFYDRGVYYAPAIYYKNEEEKSVAYAIIKAVDESKIFGDPLPLAVLPSVEFWPAEDYHQDYAKKNPIRYNYYRAGSGRTKFYERVWGAEVQTFSISNNLTNKNDMPEKNSLFRSDSWDSFIKPSDEVLKKNLTPLAYKVTQESGTERPGTHPYDKNSDAGIYVDVVSGEPLFSSRDKYDSGTGWPSFVKPIHDDAVTLHVDKKLFSTRTEVRSRFSDSHLGHVFDDGPSERGGKRYCMNGVALRFIPKSDMEKEGYGYLLSSV